MANTITRSMALANAIEVVTDPEVREVLQKMKDSVDRPRSKSTKESEKQKENNAFREAILKLLADGNKYSVEQIKASIEGLEEASSSKISGLMNPLYEKGKGIVDKEYIQKKVHYFLK